MQNINSIAKDLAIEVKDGGEKLDKLNDQMGEANQKVEDAKKELESAAKYQKKSGKCVCCLVWIIILSLGILFIILWS